MALVVEAGDMAAVERELKALGRVRYSRGVGRGGCAARGECECKAKAANGYFHTFVCSRACFFLFFAVMEPRKSGQVTRSPPGLDMVADHLMIGHREAKFSEFSLKTAAFVLLLCCFCDWHPYDFRCGHVFHFFCQQNTYVIYVNRKILVFGEL